MWLCTSSSSIPWPRGSLGHHRWFCNQFSPFFPVLHCPLGLAELQACPFPDVVFPPLPLSALSASPFSLCFARWFWPDLMNRKQDHTTAVCVSLRWSSPRAHLHVVGMLRFMPDINQPNLPTPFLFCSCVCFCLYGPFNCISFHKFSPKLYAFSLSSSNLFLPYWSFQLYISLWKSPSALI